MDEKSSCHVHCDFNGSINNFIYVTVRLWKREKKYKRDILLSFIPFFFFIVISINHSVKSTRCALWTRRGNPWNNRETFSNSQRSWQGPVELHKYDRRRKCIVVDPGNWLDMCRVVQKMQLDNFSMLSWLYHQFSHKWIATVSCN